MITLPKIFQHMPEAAAQTTSTLYKVTREDGMILRFTDHDSKLTNDTNETFYPQLGRASAKHMDATLGEDDFELRGLLDSSYITEADLHAGLYNEAEVTEQIVSWRMPWLGAIRTETWYINTVEWMQAQGLWRGSLEGPSRKLRVLNGRRYSRNCDYILGDSKCGATVPEYVGAVAASTSKRQLTSTTAAIIALADDVTRYGVLTFTSGNNAGVSVEIRSQTTTSGTTTIISQLEFPFTIAASDAFTITEGCDHTIDTCHTKFNRREHHGGFPNMPGNDKLLVTPNVKS